ncbi:FtsX-like permease family protein [Actinophytocola sp.]|uniref:FtsX-like permease family protein n=1 Tax=Actinophytocola sp. TaxID=1872138 RepID=UPI00389B2568
MLGIALRTLRYRAGGFAATFVVLVIGGAVLLACGGLMETGIRTEIPPQRLAAAPVVVAGDQRFDGIFEGKPGTVTLPEQVRLDAGIADTIGRIPGVERVIPDVSFPAQIMGDDGARSVPGTQRGHSWASAELAPYRLSEGNAPTQDTQVVLDDATAARLGARPGSEIEIAVPGGARTFTVTGIATTDRTMATDAVFFAPDAADDLSRTPGLVDAFGVLPTAGTDVTALSTRIDAAVQGKHARTFVGTDRGRVEFGQVVRDGAKLIVLGAVFGGLAVQIVVFIVTTTLALAVQQRRRELAMLRAVGASPRQVGRMVKGEAKIVGALAMAASVMPGALLGEWLFDRLTGLGVVPPVFTFHQGFFPAVAATLIGFCTAWCAAIFVGLHARRTRPVEAMQETLTPSRWLTPARLWLGVSCLLCAVPLAWAALTVLDGPVASSTAGPAVICVATAIAVFGPGLTRMMNAVLRRPVRALTGLSGYLATANARARWLPMASAVTPIVLATSLAIFMLYYQATETAAAEKAYTDSLTTDAVVEAPAGDATGDLVTRVRKLPGVGAASAFVTSSGYLERPPQPNQDDHGVALNGVSADGAELMWGHDVLTGDLSGLRDNTIALTEGIAKPLGLAVGDEITMRLGDGADVTLRIVATLRTTESTAALLPADTLAPHTTEGGVDRILVSAAPGTSPNDLEATLAGWVAGQPGLRVVGRDALAEAFLAGQETNAWINYLLVGLFLVYAAISMVNTLVLATAHRRREFGLQRLIGSTRGQIMRMMTVEALLIAVIGSVLGALAAVTMLVPFSMAASGGPLPSGPWWILPSAVGMAVVLTLVATWVPAWSTMRTRLSVTALAPEQ